MVYRCTRIHSGYRYTMSNHSGNECLALVQVRLETLEVDVERARGTVEPDDALPVATSSKVF